MVSPPPPPACVHRLFQTLFCFLLGVPGLGTGSSAGAQVYLPSPIHLKRGASRGFARRVSRGPKRSHPCSFSLHGGRPFQTWGGPSVGSKPVEGEVLRSPPPPVDGPEDLELFNCKSCLPPRLTPGLAWRLPVFSSALFFLRSFGVQLSPAWNPFARSIPSISC